MTASPSPEPELAPEPEAEPASERRRALGPFARAFSAALALPISAALAGCSGRDYEPLCKEREDCIGGHAKDVQACVADYELAAERARIVGCAEELDAAYECYESSATCREQPTQVGCETDDECADLGGAAAACRDNQCMLRVQAPPEEQCLAEQHAFARCLDD